MSEEKNETQAAVLSGFKSGETVADLAKKHEKSPVTIYRWLEKAGLHTSKKRKKRRTVKISATVARAAKKADGESSNGHGVVAPAGSDSYSITRGVVLIDVDGAVGIEKDIALACCNLANTLIQRQRTGTVTRSHFSKVSPAEHVHMRLDEHITKLLGDGASEETIAALLGDLVLKLIYDRKGSKN